MNSAFVETSAELRSQPRIFSVFNLEMFISHFKLFFLLSQKKLVGATGFEPATLCSQSRCAARLRYAPIIIIEMMMYLSLDYINLSMVFLLKIWVNKNLSARRELVI